ncbi:MAG: hypothetical protein OSJ22_07645, partial [Rikenellaceae bacterium]|nr:hypothetical protein [Rikenellaceae bacterium]
QETSNTEKTQTSNYTKHNCERQSTESRSTATNKERRKAYSQQQKIPSEARDINPNKQIQIRRKTYSR